MMVISDYIALLNKEQIEQIKEADEEYIFFAVSIANVGANINIETSSDIELEWQYRTHEDNWNGYDIITYVEEIQNLIKD